MREPFRYIYFKLPGMSLNTPIGYTLGNSLEIFPLLALGN